jgi:2-polyprenyl-3-methyl-5-hydroxy-6-metoxy-1,4-benzoquinol methylase
MIAMKNSSFKLQRGNGLKKVFHKDFFDIIICLSVIEHNVNIEQFFIEMYRILKPKGILYLSTDYWEEKIFTRDRNKIFSKTEIKSMLDFAEKTGFKVNKDIPKCKDKVVYANDEMYTFLSVYFKK